MDPSDCCCAAEGAKVERGRPKSDSDGGHVLHLFGRQRQYDVPNSMDTKHRKERRVKGDSMP